ncbi:endonuclease domain-containing 1 protein [Hemicordylus capensis]|uniref:endonuclease domain-containing 1 protein n=1 Tax=Hemicordylus capensis TaxID=884348 RepID=UPI00230389F0|nr:endonuclease domain-containing 1 protein [Hemicordylus capensis]
MRILFALCLIAGAFSGLARGRVVGEEEDGFAECGAFFYQGAPPEGLAGPAPHVKICQKYNREPRFATLYSTQDKIPLYSAFRYTEEEAAPSGEEKWLVEPQIDDPKNGLEGMMLEAEITDSVDNLGANQALTADYVDSGYERGQLNPSSLHRDDHQVATFTLTNAVPLTPPLQETWHWEVENLVRQALAPHCENGKDLYLLSGAVPSTTLKVKDKVAIPELLWLAACCDDGSEAWSVGFTKQASAEDRLEDLPVEDLEKKLSKGHPLFKNHCGKDRHHPKKLETVSKSIKGIKGQKPVPKAKQTSPGKKECCGFVKKLFNLLVSPIFTVLKGIYKLIVMIVKTISSFLCNNIKMAVNGLWTLLKGATTTLLSILIDVVRVFVNILNAIAQNVYTVLMIGYKIICIPVNLILDVVSFPFYVLGAIPHVLKEIVTGFSGLFLLIINAITSVVTGLNSIISSIAHRLLPKVATEL